MNRLVRNICTAGALVLFSAATASAQSAFQFKEIKINNSVETVANGINRARTIVGTFASAADNANEVEHGFIRYKSGYIQKPLNSPHSVDTAPLAINNEGDITGESAFYVLPGTLINRCFLREHGHYELFDVPFANGSFPDCNGINNHGDIVGAVDDSVFGGNHGFIRSEDGDFTQLDVPGATNTEATGVNDDGDVVGFYTDAMGFDHGFLYDDGNYTYPIDFPGGVDTNIFGINNRHEIVGSYTSPTAVASIVPTCPTGSSNDHGFMRKSDGTFLTIDVTLPNCETNAARGINDDSWIVGIYTDDDGINQGFLTREP